MTKQYPSPTGRLLSVPINSGPNNPGPINLEPPASTFSSDNSAGAHPAVLEAIARANHGHALAYGNDPFTRHLEERLDELFGRPVSAHLVWNGTGGNVLALAALHRAGGAVVCTDSAHLHVDETAAPERIVGTKLIAVPHSAGKLTPECIDEQAAVLGNRHHAQPCTISITQVTEYGTVYSPAEVAALCEAAHRHGMRVHLDGARIANAVAALGGSLDALRSFTVDAGVDVVTFGGTKNGMLYGEAVVFLDPALAVGASYLHKQVTQLPSKMRFVAAQFNALLDDDLWIRNAQHANSMATLLHQSLADLVALGCVAPAANSLYPVLEPDVAEELQRWSFFYPWNMSTQQYRWMTAWDTTPEDVQRFAAGVRSAVSR
jgi:threonine aldolase